MDEIINDFITESNEGLESLNQKFVELEKKPGDTTLLNDIFRSIHTIKGAAGFLGFQQTVDVTHVAEDVLNKLRKGEMALTPLIMDSLLQSVDLIKILLHNIKERNNKEENCVPVINALNGILSGNVKSQDASGGPPATPSAQSVNEPPETGAPAAKPDEAAHSKEKEHSIRVDIDRLDSVMNLAGELVLSRNRLMRLGSKIGEPGSESDLASQIDEAIAQLDLVTTDLQLAVMKIRMQPIAKVFNKFPRMVRDLARQNNKEIELVISGEETEVDKTVIEEIGDPLVHVMRNSSDHGIETPEERAALGKARHGTIKLSAYQEGRNIIVSVEDDGRGMDPKAIKRSAVEKGLISNDDAAKMSDSEALNLIFIPGFSTAKKISNISGRGVGMDVVKTNITRINGTISIDSEVGRGTRMVFSLPLTLAIIQVLTVEAGREVYGIPLSTVIENIRVDESEIRTVDGQEVIKIRDKVYPVVRLESLISANSSNVRKDWGYIVIIGLGEQRFGLHVEALHGQEEIVMKSMGEYLKGTEGIAGACITGDGNVILVLDIAGLVEAYKKSFARS